MQELELTYSPYVQIGGMIVLREGLSETHPEHLYNYLVREKGVIPENYGVYKPSYLQYKDYTRDELINVIVKLQESLDDLSSSLNNW